MVGEASETRKIVMSLRNRKVVCVTIRIRQFESAIMCLSFDINRMVNKLQVNHCGTNDE